MTIIRIGTRGSKLALLQAEEVSGKLIAKNPDIKTEIVIINTTGDNIQDRNLTEIGGKGLFTKELEEQLISGEIDIAVHSMKDIPADIDSKFTIEAILKREDFHDAFISYGYNHFEDLPEGAVVGSSSPRRIAQALAIRPDLKFVPFRGNINTRLKKLADGEVKGTFLAVAGLKRAGLISNIVNPINTEEMLPAAAQGAIGIEIRSGNNKIADLLKPLADKETTICVEAERKFLKEFGGTCQTPIAALAEINNNKINIRCLIANFTGTKILSAKRNGNIGDSNKMALDAALELKKSAGEGFFNK